MMRSLTISASAIYQLAKKNYIGAHLRSRRQSAAVKFYQNLSAIYMKLCAQTFPSIFRVFFSSIFDHNSTNIVAPLGDGNGHSIVDL